MPDREGGIATTTAVSVPEVARRLGGSRRRP